MIESGLIGTQSATQIAPVSSGPAGARVGMESVTLIGLTGSVQATPQGLSASVDGTNTSSFRKSLEDFAGPIIVKTDMAEPVAAGASKGLRTKTGSTTAAKTQDVETSRKTPATPPRMLGDVVVQSAAGDGKKTAVTVAAPDPKISAVVGLSIRDEAVGPATVEPPLLAGASPQGQGVRVLGQKGRAETKVALAAATPVSSTPETTRLAGVSAATEKVQLLTGVSDLQPGLVSVTHGPPSAEAMKAPLVEGAQLVAAGGSAPQLEGPAPAVAKQIPLLAEPMQITGITSAGSSVSTQRLIDAPHFQVEQVDEKMPFDKQNAWAPTSNEMRTAQSTVGLQAAVTPIGITEDATDIAPKAMTTLSVNSVADRPVQNADAALLPHPTAETGALTALRADLAPAHADLAVSLLSGSAPETASPVLAGSRAHARGAALQGISQNPQVVSARSLPPTAQADATASSSGVVAQEGSAQSATSETPAPVAMAIAPAITIPSSVVHAPHLAALVGAEADKSADKMETDKTSLPEQFNEVEIVSQATGVAPHIVTPAWTGESVVSTAVFPPHLSPLVDVKLTGPSVPGMGTPASLHAEPLAALEATAFQSDSGPAQHTTLVATPNVLEVGVASGSHGWLKVRAELDGSGGVAASVTANSNGSAETMHRSLPALSAYLSGASVGLSSLVVNQTPSPVQAAAAGAALGAAHDASMSLGTGTGGGGMTRDQAQLAPRPEPTPLNQSLESVAGVSSEPGEDPVHSLLSKQNSVSEAGSWLSVRA